MYRLVSEKQTAEIHKLEDGLSERFAVFEAMLRSQHVVITTHMEKVLPQIAAELEGLGRKPSDLSVDELDALVRSTRPAHLLHRPLAQGLPTNLAYNMNLVFPKGSFTTFLNSVFGANKVMSDGIDLSAVTGTLRTYSYFGPKDKDYIVESRPTSAPALPRAPTRG